mmetsp:Transcript_27494/g.36515  ORF Transcript_27494/g.36515 Transcript_27494/m.36515 type:complete len:120 (-) Transcript_27494:147-506(-)
MYLSQPDETEKLLEVVYISSDMSKEQMEQAMSSNHGPWGSIPFDNVEERSNVKRNFGVCAAKEMKELQMDGPGQRKFGIPTIILINCETEEVMTTDGERDLMESGNNVLNKWKEMLTLS